MRFGGSIESRYGLDEPGYEVPAKEPEVQPRYAVSPLGFAFVCLGALGILVSEFLPLDEPTGLLTTVAQNTPIQNEGGSFLPLAVIAVIAAYRSYRTGRRGWTPIVCGVLAVAYAVYMGTDKSLRTLYPVDPNGLPDTSQHGTVAALGIAVYAAGAGGLLVAWGGWLIRRSPLAPMAAATKQCPGCAEHILAAARICKHCGAQQPPLAEDG